jgi:hypothetical protein
MAELLKLIGAIVMILVGIAILLQIISVQEVFGFLGRCLALFALMLVLLCILKGFWLGVMVPWLSAAFEFLKTLIEWLLLSTVGLVVLSLVAQLALRQLGRQLTLRRDPQTGVRHGINDSKDPEN